MLTSPRPVRTFSRALALACVALLVPSAYASGPLTTQMTITVSTHHDTSKPLRDIAPKTNPASHNQDEMLRIPRPDAIDLPDAAVQKSVRTARTPQVTLTPGASFNGLGVGFPNFSITGAPSDNNLSVGPKHIVDVVNTDFTVLSKTGSVLLSARPINTLWTGFGGGCEANNDGDPVALYDKMADRWFIAQFSVTTTPYLYCVAVSTTGDPTGSYNRYSFNYGTTDFPDYPKVGVWPDAYYASFNIFANGSTFTGAKACAFDRANMLAGQPATQQCFQTTATYGGLLPSDQDGSQLPPAGTPDLFLALGPTNSELDLWKFHVDWTTPSNTTFTGPAIIAIAGFSNACAGGTCIPQKGTSQKLDSLADRLMYRLSYRNFGNYESLFVNHSVTAGTGVGVRWYEIRSPNGTPTVFQQGTFAPDSRFRWMGSIASDKVGDLALGYSLSSSGDFPSISFTGRVPGDPLGSLNAETSLFVGSGSQLSNLSRWGDYSSMSVDPVDDCTFWYTNTYLQNSGTFNWSTRIGSFKFPTCGSQSDFSLSSSPASATVTAGSSTTYTETATSVNGFSGNVDLTISGLPNGSSGSFSPNPVAVPASGSASSTLNVTTTSTTPAGSYTLTIGASSGSLSHNDTVTLTVSQPKPATTLSPLSLSFGNVAVSSTSPSRTLTLTNNQASVLSIGSITFSGDYARGGGSCLTSLSANASCTVLVKFTPTGLGSRPGTVTITHNAPTSPQTATLSGTGISQTTISPTSLNFGTVTKGSTSPSQTLTLKNNQLRTLKIAKVTTVGDYKYSGGTCPVGTTKTIAAGASCTIKAVFKPTATGSRPGTLTITHNAGNSPQSVKLSGTGK